MHGLLGGKKRKRKQKRHMWPVPTNATTVASSDSLAADSFCKDGRKICVGDCALFKPPQDSPPFIGIIRRLTLDKPDCLNLGVNWLYRPADVKLEKGILLEAAPNEVFYSFHKDEIPAASLLHPCKVSFLRKGVELPSGVSSFVCRRVYDIENSCLWWLTDKDYIKERQEEVDKLLEKTRLEMHGAVQSGGCSPKPLNGTMSAQQLKSGTDSIQNSTSSFSSQVKGKKRERGDQGSDPIKRERVSKTEEDILKSEIAKITDKGGLVDFEGVKKLVQLMQPESGERKIDLASRIMLADVIAVTDSFDCLGQFVQLRGLPVLDEWLQEVHRGKIGDGSPKESDKSVEEFLLALLRSLDKLPVNLHALQTCNVGKSVNLLRSHKNSEIQRKARSLVDTWKKRVEAEMKINDAKSGASRTVSWPSKQISNEVSNIGNRKTVGSSEVGPKVTASLPSASKVKLASGESVAKSSLPPSSTKPLTVPAAVNSKDPNLRPLVAGGTSELPLTPIKEERSSSSSQSPNNSLSCSSDHAKTMGSSYRSTAGSVNVNKSSIGSSRHRKSSNGLPGSVVVPRETGTGKASASERNLPSEKPSPTMSHDKLPDVPIGDHGNGQKFILRLPNTGRSPGRGTGVGSYEDSSGREPVEKNDHHDRKLKGKGDAVRVTTVSYTNKEACRSKDGFTGSDYGNGLSHYDERRRVGEEGDKLLEASKATSSSLGIIPRTGKSYEASLSSINALIESCVKFSEASASGSPGDDVGMNLLASVAAGEICKSENVSPTGSPGRSSPAPEESSSGTNRRVRQSGEEVAQTQCQPSDDGSTGGQDVTVVSSQVTDEVRNTASPVSPTASGDRKVLPFRPEEKLECSAELISSFTNLQQNADDPCLMSDVKPADASVAKKEDYTEVEGSSLLHEQKKSGQWSSNINISDSKLNGRSPLFNEDKKVDRADGLKVEKEVNSECQNTANKESVSGILTEQKPCVSTENHSLPVEIKSKDFDLRSASGNVLESGSKDDKSVDVKADHGEQTDRQPMDVISSNSNHNSESAEQLGKKESLLQCSGASVSHVESSAVIVQAKELSEKPNAQKLNGVMSEVTDEQLVTNVDVPVCASAPDMAVKLDFDLNEGYPVDDGSQVEISKLSVPSTSAGVHLPCPVPLPISSMSGSFPASITVAAAAKGPFVLPENPSRGKSELGWKGSAATSAFRPAEPRKNMEMLLSTTDILGVDTSASKPGRPPLDFDLNVPDERVLEDFASRSSAQATCSASGDRGAGGLDLDLNRIDESPEVGSFAVSSSCGMEISSVSKLPSLVDGLSNAEVNVSRDFDLNNGPGLDEVVTEAVPRSQHTKSSLPFRVPTPGVRINNADFGSFSSWFPPGNAYSAITVPPILPGRGEQSYLAASGSQRILGPTGSTSFNPELYRGPVLSSTPAVAFPASTPFQYPGFPFETSFPLSSNSFSGCSTAYMDSSSAGPVCYPTIPSQLVGSSGVVSSPYPRSYVMNLPGGTSNVSSESRKWGNQGLDLNAGPGTDMERRDDRIPSTLRQVSHPGPQAMAEDQLKVFQMTGNILKRKEPDGGWDAADRFSYKQPSWQ